MKSTIALLLERGADPNASSLPLPVLFFAVKAADIKACEALLAKGADTSIRLDEKVCNAMPGVVLTFTTTIFNLINA